MSRGTLVERASESAAVGELLTAAQAGHGGVLVFEGPAGIGKTALLDDARRRATADKMTVVAAQGAVLEQDFGFGVVRQLFEPLLSSMPAPEQGELLAGAAAMAEPVVVPNAGRDTAPVQQTAVTHGLYWLTANLGERSPILMVVDDLHWCDPPTLQFLVYLARRVEGLPVALVAARRTGDPQSAALDELVGLPDVRVIRPAPLTREGVRRLIGDRLGEPEQAFTEACLAATGGVPFLVDELVRALHVDHVTPTAASAERITDRTPPRVGHATMLRLSRLPASATAVAHAVSVLGRQARMDRVIALSGVERDEARRAFEALTAMDVLAGTEPPRFTHPLVRQAVYDDLSAAARADAHGRVGALLLAEEAPPDEIAVHLLLSAPEGRPEVVGTLRLAATDALARGAPASAVAYLRRALNEGATRGTDHAALVHELASAEAFAWDPRAFDDLREARRLASDPVSRAAIAAELAQSYLLAGDWIASHTLLGDALQELDGRDAQMEAYIEFMRSGAEIYDKERVALFDERVPRLRSLVDRAGRGGRALALMLAARTVLQTGDAADARALIEFGLDGGRFLRDEGSESFALMQAVGGLVALGDLDAAERVAADVLDDALRRSPVLGFVNACLFRTLVETQRGRLQIAETYLRSAFERSLEHGINFPLPTAMWAGTDVLLERSAVDDIAQFIENLELEPPLRTTINAVWVQMIRGRLRLLRGHRLDGIADLRAAGELADAIRLDNPIALPWRSPLAVALPPEQRDEANRLVDYELDRARAMDLPRAEGVALRAAGVIEGGPEGIELLEQSLAILERVDAPLERARTLVELGAAMRRANQRVAAREPLRTGLELAHLCGAERLAARATDELHASGIRPRRRRVTGPDALTSAESRVVGMAAGGLSNKDIAEALFVTVKTVENQLNAAYRKLGVRSREELHRALSSDLSG